MKSRVKLVGITGLLGVMLLCSLSYAAPVYFTADAELPSGLGTLTAERTLFQNTAASNGVALAMEGFESFVAGNPIDFGGFTATLFNGTGFTQISGNNLITTEGNSVMDFMTLGSTAVEFSFNSAINAFGIDITSIDFSPTHVSFLDDLGNVLSDFSHPNVWAGATFFGAYNDQAFSTVRFEFTGSEYLNFDQLEYGAKSAVPEPGTMLLLGSGLVGLVGYRRMRMN